jgi:hypothetical protein
MAEDFIPDGEFVPDAPPEGESQPVSHAPAQPAQAPAQTAAPTAPNFIPDDQFQSDEDTYGSAGQMAAGLAEQTAKGMFGPLSAYAETKMGVDPEGIRGRAENLGGLGVAAEMGGFAIPLFLTGGMSGEARALMEAGNLAPKAAQGTSLLAKAAQYGTLPGLVGKLGEAVGIGGKAIAGASTAAKIITGGVRGAVEMAAIQGGEEATKNILHDPNQTASNAMLNVGLASVFGTGMGMGFAAVPPLWGATVGPGVEKILDKIKMDWGLKAPQVADGLAIAPALKSALNVLGGVPKETIDNYVANSHEIMAAPEYHEVYSNLLEHVSDTNAALEQKKINVKEAANKFSNFLGEQKLALKQAGYDADAADTLANEALKQAQTRLAGGLQADAIEAAPKAFSAVQKLKEQALSLSQGARDILDNTPGELSLKPVFEAIRPMQDKLYSQGFPAMAEELQKQMDVFANQYGDKIGYPDAKSMIQGLQKRGKWTFGANELSNGLSPYFNQLSGIMNGALKGAVPAYERAMRPTADAFELLGKLDKYGTPETAVKGAVGLKNAANYANEMPMLRDLESKTGINFTHQFESYANPQLRDSMVKAMPEYAASQKAGEALQQLKDPETRAALEKAPYLSSAYRELERAQKSLDFTAEQKASLKGLTEASLEGKMKSVMSGRSIHAKNVLAGLPEMDGMSVPDILSMIATREAFEKGATNGSRNVQLMSHLGKGAGGLLGLLIGHSIEGTVAGGVGGSYLGALIDKEGPAIVKQILDRYIGVYGDLPKAVGASPEATKAGLVHFIGKDTPTDPMGFKSAINFINAAKGGGNLMKNGAKAIFQSGKVLPNQLMPDSDKKKKLDDRAKVLQNNQQNMFKIGGGLGSYMPEHAQALSAHSMRALNFINQNRPQPTKASFFDNESEPTPEQTRAYDRGLGIAQQPLIAFQHLKDNSLLPQDMQILKTMHPQYYGHMAQAVTNAMADHVSDGGKVPYQMRQSLSLFLGHALDSSMTPQSIMAAQAVFMNQKAQAQQAGAQAAPKGDTSKMSKISGQYKTAEQSAQERQSNRTA